MCGNLGLLLGEDCAFTAEDAAEAMTRVVAMRGAQSYGSGARRRLNLSVHRAVLRKRADLATTLRSALARKGRCQRTSGRWSLVPTRAFATSSRSFAKEAHPHSWLGPVRTEVNGIKTTRIVLCTHNGDFEALDIGKLFGGDSRPMALDELRRWLFGETRAAGALRGGLVRVSGVFGFVVCCRRRGERRAARGWLG